MHKNQNKTENVKKIYRKQSYTILWLCWDHLNRLVAYAVVLCQFFRV